MTRICGFTREGSLRLVMIIAEGSDGAVKEQLIVHQVFEIYDVVVIHGVSIPREPWRSALFKRDEHHSIPRLLTLEREISGTETCCRSVVHQTTCGWRRASLLPGLCRDGSGLVLRDNYWPVHRGVATLSGDSPTGQEGAEQADGGETYHRSAMEGVSNLHTVLYNLSNTELDTLWHYLDGALERVIIRH